MLIKHNTELATATTDFLTLTNQAEDGIAGWPVKDFLINEAQGHCGVMAVFPKPGGT